MATRIESKGRTVARPQAVISYDEGEEEITVTSGKPMRLDPRCYPTSFGINSTAQAYTFVGIG